MVRGPVGSLAAPEAASFTDATATVTDAPAADCSAAGGFDSVLPPSADSGRSAPSKPGGGFERFEVDANVTVYVHEDVPREGTEPARIRFDFGLQGQCTLALLD